MRTRIIGWCAVWWIAIVVACCCGGVRALSCTFDPSRIKAISLDVTGTLLVTREPVVTSYRNAAVWAKLPVVPSEDNFKRAFQTAFRERCIESPCFGGAEGISGREWWRETVRRVLDCALLDDANSYTRDDLDRYFRRVYQHFGSPAGYSLLEDARLLLESLSDDDNNNSDSDTLLLGITSNTPTRHMESILPMVDCLHDRFSWFVCSQDVGHEKPYGEIFDASLQQARFWSPDLLPQEVLHIGDSYTNDYCGAKAYGFEALLLDRSSNPSITQYQDWLEAPEYPGKSLEDVRANTITSLEQVAELLRSSSSSSQ